MTPDRLAYAILGALAMHYKVTGEGASTEMLEEVFGPGSPRVEDALDLLVGLGLIAKTDLDWRADLGERFGF